MARRVFPPEPPTPTSKNGCNISIPFRLTVVNVRSSYFYPLPGGGGGVIPGGGGGVIPGGGGGVIPGGSGIGV